MHDRIKRKHNELLELWDQDIENKQTNKRNTKNKTKQKKIKK